MGTSRTQPGMLSPDQMRAARGLLGWSREMLAEKSGVAANTAKGFEIGRTDPKISTLYQWKRAFEAAGVQFIDPDDNAGAGLRWKKGAAQGRWSPKGKR